MAKNPPACLDFWQPGDQALRHSATRLVEFALGADDLAPKAKKDLLNLALWWTTEIDGKYTTRFRSTGVIDLASADPLPVGWWKALRHDHVMTRNSLIERLHSGEAPDAVLTDAVGCTVTKDEHAALGRVDRKLEGWARYAEAGVTVLDMKTKEQVDLTPLT